MTRGDGRPFAKHWVQDNTFFGSGSLGCEGWRRYCRRTLDPPAQHRAAALLGRLAAQGLIDSNEALPALLDAAFQAAPSVDRSGLRARLAHRLADSRAAWESARRRAAFAIRSALAPLIAARAQRAALFAAADDADRSEALLPRERRAIATALFARALRERRSL